MHAVLIRVTSGNTRGVWCRWRDATRIVAADDESRNGRAVGPEDEWVWAVTWAGAALWPRQWERLGLWPGITAAQWAIRSGVIVTPVERGIDPCHEETAGPLALRVNSFGAVPRERIRNSRRRAAQSGFMQIFSSRFRCTLRKAIVMKKFLLAGAGLALLGVSATVTVLAQPPQDDRPPGRGQ